MAIREYSTTAAAAEAAEPISPAIAAMLAPFFGKGSSAAPVAAVTPSPGNRPAPAQTRALVPA